jgi:hypothetical protein
LQERGRALRHRQVWWKIALVSAIGQTATKGLARRTFVKGDGRSRGGAVRSIAIIALSLLGSLTVEAALADGTLLRPTTAVAFIKALEQQAPTLKYDCRTYEEKNIERLKRPLLEAAAVFLRAFVETHGSVTVTSAHRSRQEQTCVCAGEKGPCSRSKPSRHFYGWAIDVRAGAGTKAEYECMQDFAKKNPHLGIHFPFGMKDRPHMEWNGKTVSFKASSNVPIVPCAGPVTTMIDPNKLPD